MERSDLVKSLEAAFGTLGGLEDGLASLLQAEHAYHLQAQRYLGFVTLAHALKSFLLETVGELNGVRSEIRSPLPSEHAFYTLNIVGNFRALRAAELSAVDGYPMQGFTLLRNVYDNCVLSSAVLQGLTTFDKLSGADGACFDPAKARKRRVTEERAIRRKMDGGDSGLDAQTLSELQSLNVLYDAETHGSRLSQSQSIGWIKGHSPLHVVPEFSEREFSMFINRYNEVAWLAHRLLPSIQPRGHKFTSIWSDRWELLDQSFNTMVMALTVENGKPVGNAVRSFVKLKFPYDSKSTFPT